MWILQALRLDFEMIASSTENLVLGSKEVGGAGMSSILGKGGRWTILFTCFNSQYIMCLCMTILKASFAIILMHFEACRADILLFQEHFGFVSCVRPLGLILAQHSDLGFMTCVQTC